MCRMRWMARGLAMVVLCAWADAACAQSQDLAARIAEVWEFELRTQPEQASEQGDSRYNHLLSDGSWAGLTAQAASRRGFLTRLAAIDRQSLGPTERLNHVLLERMLRRSVRRYELKLDLLPLDQMNGIHHAPLDWMKAVPFRTVQDYENYLARLRQLPTAFAQATERARMGVRERLVPPAHLMHKVIAQLRPLATAEVQHPLAEPVSTFPAELPPAEQQRLRAAVHRTLIEQVVPAYQRLLRFVEQEYTPACRSSVAFSALPDGDKRYQFLVADHTTTALTPDQIHELGRQEVAKLEAEMTAVATQQGHVDLKSFQRALKQDPGVFATSRDQILDLYRHHLSQMHSQAALLFGRLPRAQLVVVPVEPFREAAAAGALYAPSSPDGMRPGRVVVNTREFTKQPLYFIEATAYHEGVPGHHTQMALARELPGLPAFRRHTSFAAFQEGWALYAEGLGKELGFFSNPVSEYGRLTSEMIRAVRLVLDTGLHARGWTRAQAIAYFQAHTTMDAAYIEAEVDRYIAMPAQALSYKLGQLSLRALRRRAEAALGPRFDRRAFHDQLLRNGELPLDLLEEELARWLAAQPR